MKTLPSLLIVADRGHVIAWRTDQGRVPELIQSMDIAEGLMSIDEQVTNQDGAFQTQMRGTLGRGVAPEERLTLDNEREKRALLKVAEGINMLVSTRNLDSWGFAAPGEINRAILKKLAPAVREKLTLNAPLDLTGHPAEQILEHFRRAAEKAED